MNYLGAMNSSLALLAWLRLYNLIWPSKIFSTGSVEGDTPLDVMSLLVLGTANVSQAFMNFWTGFRNDRWIMGKGFDLITVLDALFMLLDWAVVVRKISSA